MGEVLLLRPEDAPSIPWKNGRGVTRELALWPAQASFERGDYDWRISAARVEEAGPFSSFPGCERLLVVTEGAGLVLVHGERTHRARVRRLEPYRFSGEWTTTAELVGGAVSDFNVIYRPERCRPELAALSLGRRRTREPLGAGHAFAHVLAGAVAARLTGEEEPFELGPLDSLWARGLAGGEELELAGNARECAVLLVRIGPASGDAR